MEYEGRISVGLKRCNTCKQEIDDQNFLGSQCKQCHAEYIDSLGGEDQYSA